MKELEKDVSQQRIRSVSVRWASIVLNSEKDRYSNVTSETVQALIDAPFWSAQKKN